MKKGSPKTQHPDKAIPHKKSGTTLQVCVLLSVSLILLMAGWRLFWFLTDDAYISFRYASNSLLGYGYVWNFPPFRPVEGYTNFLWILILETVWRVLHVPPPVSANYLTLLFSFLTLVALSIMALRIKWRAELRPHAIVFIGMSLIFLLANRTFLAWTSSGLETSMFTFFVVAWVFSALSLQSSLGRLAFSTTLVASLMELTRPDGMLYAAGTILILVYSFIKDRHALKMAHIFAASPLLLIPLHLAWRFKTYGLWLPNSYYAKQVAWWPESGLRYAASFILEYALWAWLALVAYVVFKKTTRVALKRKLLFADLIVLAILLCHFLYYTIFVGGDHFEYRVYNHFLVFIPFSFLLLLNLTHVEVSRAIAVMALFVSLSLPVPWTHWFLTHDLKTRQETHWMKVPIAEHWPRFARWYATCFDKLQFELIDHSVCMRHQEHKICREYLIQNYPSREEGMLLPSNGYPVLIAAAVGVASWTLPRVNIIDLFGLNDYVVARMPVPPGEPRQMAHDRLAFTEYASCFYPNVSVENRMAVIRARELPLTAERIVECETEWRKTVDGTKKRYMR